MDSNFSRIEMRNDAVEAFAADRYKLRGSDAPPTWRDLQSFGNGRQCVADVPTLVLANDATDPVQQGQVFRKVDQDADGLFAT